MTELRTTSLAAKRAIRPSAGTLRAQVFVFILERGEHGATLNEIQDGLELDGNTVRPRRCELEERGFVKDSGKRRLTPKGNPAIVWVVPEDVANRARARMVNRGS